MIITQSRYDFVILAWRRTILIRDRLYCCTAISNRFLWFADLSEEAPDRCGMDLRFSSAF